MNLFRLELFIFQSNSVKPAEQYGRLGETLGSQDIWGHNRRMLYKFKSKATGDLILLEPHGRFILGLIGKEPAPKGILTVGELPGAIAALQAAVAHQEAQHAQAQLEAQSRGEEASQEDIVSLRQRAVPFIAMMKRCLDEEHDIVWGV